jgi:hypothetical protein
MPPHAFKSATWPAIAGLIGGRPFHLFYFSVIIGDYTGCMEKKGITFGRTPTRRAANTRLIFLHQLIGYIKIPVQ